MQDKKTLNRPEAEQSVGNATFDGAVAIGAVGFCSALLCLAAVVFDVTSPVLCVVLAMLLYVAATAAIILWMRHSRKREFKAGGNVSDSILRDSVLNMGQPMMLCDKEGGKIIWYNRATSPLTEGDSLFGKSFESVFGLSLDIAIPDEGEAPAVECLGRYYKLCGRDVTSGGKDFVIVTPTDITEVKAVNDRAAARETAVMYIVADNLDEMAEYEKEKYRGASAEISTVLTEWAEAAGGVLKEYDHDKYLCILESARLEENVAKRFDVLDRIRNIRVGESAVPVTVSVGVARINGSLAEKEKTARQALELALQRGGDQVVVKGEGSTDFYGGRTRTVQKRTRVRTRVFANELLMKMSQASGVMVMGHRFADFDCFGAAIGIARLAMFCGVPVHVVTDFSDSGMDACREIIMKEKVFRGVFVDRDQALDLVDSDMLLVIVDVNNMAMVESPELADRCADTVIIDHHRKTAEFEREPLMSCIEPSSAATCELVAEMLEQCLPEDMLTVSEANMMLAGISLDTKQFTRNTGTRTFSAALYLRDAGADPVAVEELFKTSLDDFTREAKFRSNVVIYRGMFAVALGDGEGESSDRIAAAKAADKLLGVGGVKASFALIKIGAAVHISARSSGQINVQLILEKLRGGGHFDSAGAQVEASSVTDALTMLKTAIDEYVENA